MKWEINLSEFTPFIILYVIVVTLPANSLGAFPLRTYMQGFSICFTVGEQQGAGAKIVAPTLRHWAQSHASSGGTTLGPASGSCFPSRNFFLYVCLGSVKQPWPPLCITQPIVLCCAVFQRAELGHALHQAIVTHWITWDHEKPKPTVVVFPAASSHSISGW